MRRHLWLVTMVGICSLAAGSVVGQQSSSPEKLRASGEHTSFEWLFLPISVAKDRGSGRETVSSRSLSPQRLQRCSLNNR